MSRSVHLARDDDQWSVRVGDQWTECDHAEVGAVTLVNGGVSGGWFGWGARQDGDLVSGQCSRSGVGLSTGARSALGSTDITDQEIIKFNRDFVKYNPRYRY